MTSYARKISANFVGSIGAELFQSAFMSLSISHWLVGFKKLNGETARTAWPHQRKSISQREDTLATKPEHICLFRVIVSATRPWVPSISAEKVSFFSPNIMAKRCIRSYERRQLRLEKGGGALSLT
jgi:hypothetical protein